MSKANPSHADPAPTLPLSKGQIECLTLVGQLQSSKQIARILGISHHTVDQRIARACQKLGVTTRAEAAMIVMRARNGEPSGFTNSDRVAIDPAAARRPAFAHLEPGSVNDEADRIDQYLVSAMPGHEASQSPRFSAWPVPSRGRRRNDLTTLQRIGWACLICAGGIFTFGMLLASLTALKNLG